jgi:Domain of unknown function (DUF2383).
LSQDEIDILNNLLESIYVEIDEYTKCINKIKNKDIRCKLEYQELKQREIAMEISSRIKFLGGNPKESTGAKGAVTAFINSLKLADNEETPDILELLMHDVKSTMTTQERVLSKLNGPSRNIIKRHIEVDKNACFEIERIKDQIFQQ